jgi:16S rRNA (guanine527-N7)-methyltransferase
MSGTEVDDRRRLEALAATWRIDCGDTQARALLAYAELLLTWSARINLTAAPSAAALIESHFPDAFALARRLEDPARIVDVGTGGGLPALPLALLRPTLAIELCEPIAKKGAFLRTAIRELALGDRVRVRATRGESLAESHPGFDAAISRATFSPAEWLTLGRRLVRPGGRVFALAAPDDVPSGCPSELYLEGRRALVEVVVPRETVPA